MATASTSAPAAAITDDVWCATTETFFRLVSGLFTCTFQEGAGALLTSYDQD